MKISKKSGMFLISFAFLKRCQKGRKGHSRSPMGWIVAALIAVVALFGSVPAHAQINASTVVSMATGTDASSFAFTSATYSNNVLYIAFTATACASAADLGLGVDIVPAVASVTGAGLTFTEIGTPGGLSYDVNGRRIQAWRALVTSGATTGVVTVTMQAGTTSSSMAAVIIAFTGTETSGTNGSGAIANYKAIEGIRYFASHNGCFREC
jgi:hypothetical protein